MPIFFGRVGVSVCFSIDFVPIFFDFLLIFGVWLAVSVVAFFCGQPLAEIGMNPMSVFETLLAVDDCECLAHEYGNPCFCNDKAFSDVEKAITAIRDELRKDDRLGGVFVEWPVYLSVCIGDVDDENHVYFGFATDEKGYGTMSWNNPNADKVGRFETQLTAKGNADMLLAQLAENGLFTETETN